MNIDAGIVIVPSQSGRWTLGGALLLNGGTLNYVVVNAGASISTPTTLPGADQVGTKCCNQ